MAEETIRLYTFKRSKEPFLALLDQHKIEYEEKSPPMGSPMASGEMIDIIVAMAPTFFPSLAAVIVAYYKAKHSRDVQMSLKNKDGFQLINARGLTKDQLSSLLEFAINLSAIDTGEETK